MLWIQKYLIDIVVPDGSAWTVRVMRLPRVMNAEDTIEYLFSASSRAQGGGGDQTSRARRRNINRLHELGRRADSLFSSYVTGFPSFNEGTFEYEMADVLIGVDELKKAIASVHGCRNNIVTVASRAARQIARARGIGEMRTARESAYGRIASMIRGIDGRLNFLSEAAQRLREIPQIDAENNVVVAGFPNVGKSSFISFVSNAKTRIEPYPFTTTRLIIGRGSISSFPVDFIDSPGLTERAFRTTNQYERKALLAIKYKASLLLYIVDPTGSCGYSTEVQTELYEALCSEFGTRRRMVAYSKADISGIPSSQKIISFSSMTGYGMDVLLGRLNEELFGKGN